MLWHFQRGKNSVPSVRNLCTRLYNQVIQFILLTSNWELCFSSRRLHYDRMSVLVRKMAPGDSSADLWCMEHPQVCSTLHALKVSCWIQPVPSFQVLIPITANVKPGRPPCSISSKRRILAQGHVLHRLQCRPPLLCRQVQGPTQVLRINAGSAVWGSKL